MIKIFSLFLCAATCLALPQNGGYSVPINEFRGSSSSRFSSNFPRGSGRFSSEGLEGLNSGEKFHGGSSPEFSTGHSGFRQSSGEDFKHGFLSGLRDSNAELHGHDSGERFGHGSFDGLRHGSGEGFRHSSGEEFIHSSGDGFRHGSGERFQQGSSRRNSGEDFKHGFFDGLRHGSGEVNHGSLGGLSHGFEDGFRHGSGEGFDHGSRHSSSGFSGLSNQRFGGSSSNAFSSSGIGSKYSNKESGLVRGSEFVGDSFKHHVAILRDDRQDPVGGEYSFAFESEDGIKREESGSPIGPNGAVIQQGYWAYTHPDGTPAKFKFIADENGFQVDSNLLPKAHPLPAHAIAQIEKAERERAQGIFHDGQYRAEDHFGHGGESFHESSRAFQRGPSSFLGSRESRTFSGEGSRDSYNSQSSGRFDPHSNAYEDSSEFHSSSFDRGQNGPFRTNSHGGSFESNSHSHSGIGRNTGVSLFEDNDRIGSRRFQSSKKSYTN